MWSPGKGRQRKSQTPSRESNDLLTFADAYRQEMLAVAGCSPVVMDFATLKVRAQSLLDSELAKLESGGGCRCPCDPKTPKGCKHEAEDL